MRKFIRRLLLWLHRIFVKSFPPGSPQEERVELERVAGAIAAVNACLPQEDPDSGTATATSGLTNACTTLSGAVSVFVLQMQVAVCWLWAQIQAVTTDVTAAYTAAIAAAVAPLEADIDAIEAQLPPVHVGTPTITAGAAAGGSPTFTLLTGSDDTQGAVDVTLGSAPTAAGGILFTLQFGANFAAQIFPLACARVGAPLSTAGIFFTTFESATAPVSACAIVSHSPTSAFLAGQIFRVSYRVGFTA